MFNAPILIREGDTGPNPEADAAFLRTHQTMQKHRHLLPEPQDAPLDQGHRFNPPHSIRGVSIMMAMGPRGIHELRPQEGSDEPCAKCGKIGPHCPECEEMAAHEAGESPDMEAAEHTQDTKGPRFAPPHSIYPPDAAVAKRFGPRGRSRRSSPQAFTG